MIKIEVVLSQKDIRPVSDALKGIKVGGITISKVKGRGKSIAPKIITSLHPKGQKCLLQNLATNINLK